MASPAQVVQLSCPNCGSPMRAQVVTFIDVGQQPQLKSYLLSGQINSAVCPSCGNAAMLAAPLVYHDPDKQLFLTFFPQQMNATPQDQERFIGEATSLLMRALPPEAPKGYVLAPKRFLTMNSLIEAVLEADGVTKEMIDAQRRQIALISELAEVYETNPESFPTLVEQRKADLDDAFFAMLDAFVASSMQAQRDDSAQLLGALRDQLIALTGYQGALGDEVPEIPLDEVLERLVSASDEELEQQIGELRPAIDYNFYEALTAQIDALAEAGDSAEATRLTERRATILATVERFDREAQEMFDAGATLLRAALEADDPEAALRAQAQQINEAFLLIIDANIAAAERAGQAEIAQRLADIQELAVQIAEESLPPAERFINQLLNAPTPQDATSLLRQNAATVNVPLVRRMNELADEMEKDARKPVGERLRQLAREAGAMLF